VDEARFPDGLEALTDYAHERGLKFGIWVEPERVALSTVNRAGLAQEGWLARRSGGYGSTDSAQLCLASPEARQWVLDKISRLIDAVGPDYVKWDNNFWINCDRPGHGHGLADGNFGHVTGLYDLLGELRARYPQLLFENVSGGGTRLDVGMMRYSDVGWMDDRTAPSVHVRHILGGLTALFPPPYLLSFVMHHEDEPLQDAADFPLYFRSRSPGALGLCFRTRQFDDGDREQMASEIEIYKTTRDALGAASAILLTPQAAADGGPAWDVLQTTSPGARTIVLSAIQWSEAEDEVTIKPIGLRRGATYSVRSVDTGEIGTATGAELMADGIRVPHSPISAAHIIIVRRQ
jgi:alpha-galactosidase